MKKHYFHLFQLMFLSLFVMSCSNNATTNIGNDDTTNLHSSDQSSNATVKWDMGIALYSFNLFPFSVSLDKADSAGVKYVEGFSFHVLKGEFKDSTMADLSSQGIMNMKRLLDEKGLKMRSMYVAGGKDAEDWKRYFEMAKTLGMDFIVCEPKKAHWNILDSLGEIYKIKIAIHEHAKGSSAYWHPDSVLAAIKGHKNIGACADLGHWTRSGLDAVKCLNQLKGHILCVHLKDVAKAEIDGEDVIVGKGVIDFAGVTRELKAQHYKGMVYVECEHKMNNNVPDIIESMQYFNKVAAGTK
ncbi:MAG: sugar phosphate isomerase/epimerase [Bacteroidota bacterium]